MNYTNGMSLLARNVPRLIVENNEIRFGRYGGMEIDGSDGSLMNDMIRYNNVHHVMWLHDDSGGIYVTGWLSGTKIYQNWVHDIARGPWAMDYGIAGIYLDNNSAYITISDNVLMSPLPAGTMQTYEQTNIGAHDNTWTNNDTQSAAIINASGPKMIVGVETGKVIPELYAVQINNKSVITGDLMNYTALYGENEVNITAIVSQYCTLDILVDGNSVTMPFELKPGKNRFTFRVIPSDNQPVKDYVLEIFQPFLYDIQINNQSVPIEDIMSYSVLCGENEVNITPIIPQYCTSVVLVDGKPVAMPYKLKPGMNRFTLRVIASDNQPVKDYMIEIIQSLDIILPYYDKVLAVNLNTETNGGYTFSGIQWQKNGQNIPGKTDAYLYVSSPHLADEYGAVLTTNTGQVLLSCIKQYQPQSRSADPVLMVYPNPVQDHITVENEEWEKTTDIVLYDKNGIKLQTYPVSGFQTSININGYPEGTYILQSGKLSTKIIIK
jgi:hypothetical protein